MSGKYLCGKCRLNISHIIHKEIMRDRNGEMQCVEALIDCGAMSIIMALRLRKPLDLADEPTYITTLRLNVQVIARTSESQGTMFMVQYMEQLLPVHESEAPVVPMLAYDLVLGLP